jgi:four helix bundle suffix protein
MRRMRQMGCMLGDASEGFIPPHGGYAGSLAYKKALIVFQGTCRFCERFLEKRDRTVDQMVQAARSGKQNIVEASKISGTSKEAEIKLLNVSRSSLEELLEDYSDFLRKGKVSPWPKNGREPLFVRQLARKENVSYETYETYIETRLSEVLANIIICLIHQTNYLLDPLIRKLEKDFLAEGGLHERMTRARLAHRAKQKRSRFL